MNLLLKTMLCFIMFGVGGIFFPQYVYFDGLQMLIYVSCLFVLIELFVTVISSSLIVQVKGEEIRINEKRVLWVLVLTLICIPFSIFCMSSVITGFSVHGISTYLLLFIGSVYIFYIQN